MNSYTIAVASIIAAIIIVACSSSSGGSGSASSVAGNVKAVAAGISHTLVI